MDITASNPAARTNRRAATGEFSRGLGSRESYGYLFLAPWFIGFFGLSVGPMIWSFYLSFTNFDLLTDPKWVGAAGSYMAGILATPAYEVLGKTGYGVDPSDYITAPMPAVNQLVGGELAWRQHDGGHTQEPNFPAFFQWVRQYISAPDLH